MVGCFSLLPNDDRFCLTLQLHALGHICNVNERVDSNIQASREEYKAATLQDPTAERETKQGNILARCFVELFAMSSLNCSVNVRHYLELSFKYS